MSRSVGKDGFFHRMYRMRYLETQLGSAPVTTLGVPLNFVVRTKTDPLWKRTILTLLLRQCPLGAESLLGWLYHFNICVVRIPNLSLIVVVPFVVFFSD